MVLLFVLLAAGALLPAAGPPDALAEVRGVTISCQTWGHEWGAERFDDELEELGRLGVNWVAIHPYAVIRADGTVRPIGLEGSARRPPAWLARPLSATDARGLGLLVKPHLAYWGSPFRWRGEIEFQAGSARERFWRTYADWIVELARSTRGAEAFCVGTELDRMLGEEDRWRELVARVRDVTDAKLTYAANWDRFSEVPFWDALDAIGVQAYFPLSDAAEPSSHELRAAWQEHLAALRALHEQTGKPVVFTELGYHAGPLAAERPWDAGSGAAGERERELQERCLRVALELLAREREWLRGAFLWKWFVGEPGRNDRTFLLDVPALRSAIAEHWTSPRARR